MQLKCGALVADAAVPNWRLRLTLSVLRRLEADTSAVGYLFNMLPTAMYVVQLLNSGMLRKAVGYICLLTVRMTLYSGRAACVIHSGCCVFVPPCQAGPLLVHATLICLGSSLRPYILIEWAACSTMEDGRDWAAIDMFFLQPVRK